VVLFTVSFVSVRSGPDSWCDSSGICKLIMSRIACQPRFVLRVPFARTPGSLIGVLLQENETSGWQTGPCANCSWKSDCFRQELNTLTHSLARTNMLLANSSNHNI
jgi:hypothetical protein